MYEYPSDEVVNQIKSMFGNPDEFELTTGKTGYEITVSQSYEYVSFVGISMLMGMAKIASLLNCVEGDEISRWSSGGCPTCDYGSTYEVSWKFWNP